jgi:thioredoxin 1
MGKFQKIIGSSTPTLVEFYGTWCKPCRTMNPILDELKIQRKDRLSLMKIDVDKNLEITNQFKIRSVPTLILFQSGEIIWRKSGVMIIKEILALVN